MAEITYQGQIVREAPEIEAYKLGLLKEAQGLYGQPMNLPAVEAAGLSQGQQQAADLARQGIGAYQPYLEAGSAGITQGQNVASQGASVLSGINTAPQFNAAQNATLAGITAAGGVGQAANIAGNYLQANLAPSQNMLGQAANLSNQMVTQGAPAQQAALGSIGQGQAAFGQMAGGAAAQGTGRSMVGQGAQRANEMVGAGMAGINQGQQTIGQGAAVAGQIANAGLGAQQTGQGYVAQGADMAGQMVGAGIGAQQQGLSAVQQGIAGLQQATRAYDPYQAQAFMNPYQEQVTQKALEQMRRQGDIANQGLAAQAVRAGAFGGTREGVQRAEQERNLQDVMSQRIFQDMAANYGQAQTAAMTAAEQQQQRQLAASQGITSAGTALGSLGTNAANIYGQAGQQLTQAGTAAGALGANAANILSQEAQALGSLGTQQGALGTQAANIYGQSGQQLTQAGQAVGALGANEANIYGQMGQGLTQAGQAQSAVGTNLANIYGQAGQQLGNIGTTLGQQGISQAQLGQSGASTMGSLAGQQAQLYGTLGQGIGSLANQQAGIELQKGASLGSIGTNIGSMGVQQAALGQAAQQLNAGDVNLLSGIGSIEQQNAQAQLDAQRATQLQETMAPYQQLAFVSDIYKGAPSSQMSLTSSSAPSASPLQSAIGTGVGAVATAAGASKAGLF